MMRYPQLGEVYPLCGRIDHLDERRGRVWKVTACFAVRTSADEDMRCVRLRPVGGAPPECFTLAEFHRLFWPAGAPSAERLD